MPVAGQRKRVLIVNCYLDETRRLKGRPHFVPQAIGPAYLAAAFNQELTDILLYNELASGPLLDETLFAWPDMLVMTSMTSGFDRMRHIAAYVRTKAPKCVIVAGGPAVRSLPQLSRQFFDHCCSGDVEELQSVVGDVFGADYVSTSTTPRFDLVHWTWRLGYVESSRNCNFKCSFCSLTGERLSYQTYDLDYLRRQLDAVGRKTVIVFADNNFYGNDRSYFLAKLDLLKHYWKKKKMFRAWAALVTNDFFVRPENLRLVREAGCGSLFTGVESFDANVLRGFNKLQNLRLPQVEMIRDCLNAGIILNYGVIFDASARSLSEIKNEISFITGTPEITLPVFMNLTIPLLRTPYFHECVRDRRLLPKTKLRDMDGNTLIMTPVDPVEDVVQFLKDMPTLRGFKARVLRHSARFLQLYYRKLDPLFLAVAVGNAGFLCMPALVHNHQGFLKRQTLKSPPRTYITTTEPAGPLYEPFIPIAEKYRHYFQPTMITDERGELTAEVAGDLHEPAPRAMRVAN
jgi:hopanoid C-2 methylase